MSINKTAYSNLLKPIKNTKINKMSDFDKLIPKKSQLKKIFKSYKTELKLANSGLKTSFGYLHSPIPQKRLKPKNKTFQVLMFGGSHIETGLMSETSKGLKLTDFNKSNIPLLINKQVFCETFARYLHPEVEHVALNFAYPLETILRSTEFGQVIDGILVGAPKGHTFDGMLSKTVGLELEKYIFKKTRRRLLISVCNDSTALCLASLGLKEGYNWQNTMVGIVGTGTNFGFFENSKTMVNLESANFDKFEQSKTGKIIDAISDNPLKHLLEKEISGGYLYKHFNIIAKEHNLPFHLNSTQQLDQLAKNIQPEDLDTILANDPDGQIYANQIEIPKNYNQLLDKAILLAQRLIKRSAFLVACKIAGLYSLIIERKTKLKKQLNFEVDNDTSENNKVLILMEGSLFWSSLNYQEWVEEGLTLLEINPKNILFEHKKHAGIIGAAKLLTT